jgi:hypothetical protein
MVFLPSRPNLALIGPSPSHVAYRDPFAGIVAIKLSQQVRYLGLFIDSKLTWKPHVKIMAARARSTLKSLSLLGNSVRGLRFAAWRRLYHAILVPTLTYGIAAWHPLEGTRKGLISVLQVAQNDALRKMSGCFRTTPIDPLHNLLAIPPMEYTARKLVRSYSDRLARLPPTHLVHTILSHNPASAAYTPSTPSTALTRLHAASPASPPFTLPPPVRDRRISHTRLVLPSAHRPTPQDLSATRRCMTRRAAVCPVIFITEVSNSVDGFVTAWSIQSDLPLVQGLASHFTRAGALLQAVYDGMASSPFLQNYGQFNRIDILLPAHAANGYISSVRPGPLLALSARLRSFVSGFLALPHSPSLAFRRYSIRRPHARHIRDAVADLVSRTPLDPPPLPAPPDRKAEMYAEWLADYTPSSHPAAQSCRPPNGNRPPPFIRGVLARGNRRLFSAAVQVSTGHAFTADYSRRFRPSAGDRTSCHCSTPTHPEDHTRTHVLFDCRRHASQRLAAFASGTPSASGLFRTFQGGHALGEFLWSTFDLLIPLPPPTPQFRSPDA